MVCLQITVIRLYYPDIIHLDDDEESCSTSHNTKKFSKIATSPSVTGSHQDSAYLTCSEKGKNNCMVVIMMHCMYTHSTASVGTSSISNQPSPTSHRKPYKG